MGEETVWYHDLWFTGPSPESDEFERLTDAAERFGFKFEGGAHHLGEPGPDPIEAQRDELARKLERAENALKACARVSGADLSDGFPTWPELPDYALQEVQTLRENYDEALNEIPLSPARKEPEG